MRGNKVAQARAKARGEAVSRRQALEIRKDECEVLLAKIRGDRKHIMSRAGSVVMKRVAQIARLLSECEKGGT